MLTKINTFNWKIKNQIILKMLKAEQSCLMLPSAKTHRDKMEKAPNKPSVK